MQELWDKIDKAEATKVVPQLLPEGTYEAIVTNVSVKEIPFPEAVEFSVEFSLTTEGFENRKCWFNGIINDQSSAKKVSFYKGMICKLAGVDTTAGNPMEVLMGCKGNSVSIDLKHTPGKKDPTKTYLNVYVNEKIS